MSIVYLPELMMHLKKMNSLVVKGQHICQHIFKTSQCLKIFKKSQLNFHCKTFSFNLLSFWTSFHAKMACGRFPNVDFALKKFKTFRVKV